MKYKTDHISIINAPGFPIEIAWYRNADIADCLPRVRAYYKSINSPSYQRLLRTVNGIYDNIQIGLYPKRITITLETECEATKFGKGKPMESVQDLIDDYREKSDPPEIGIAP